MALTVRLGAKAERTLSALARKHRLSRSEVVREALARYDAADRAGDEPGRPYRSWIDVVGIVTLGARDPNRTTGEQFASSLQRKAARGRSAR